MKGKALVDSKLVKDYEIKDGATITVMSKVESTPKAAEPESLATPSSASPNNDSQTVPSPNLEASPSYTHKRRVSDIPAVVLSPAGTPAQTTPLLQPTSIVTDALTHLPPSQASPIPLDLNSIPLPPSVSMENTPYHSTIASPQFWLDLREFLEARFSGKDDGDAAFEEFLLSAKSKLSPHEIAKIRDEVGKTGMAGH